MEGRNRQPSIRTLKWVAFALMIVGPLFVGLVLGLVSQDFQVGFGIYCILMALEVAMMIGAWILKPYLLLPESVRERIIELLSAIGIRAISIVPVGVVLYIIWPESHFTLSVKLIALAVGLVCLLLALNGFFKDGNNAKP